MIKFDPISVDSIIAYILSSVIWSYVVLFQILKAKKKGEHDDRDN